MDIIADYWVWWILAAILMGLEIFAPGAFMIWIGLAAGLTGGFAWVFSGVGIESQLLFFAVFSVTLAIVGRHYVRKKQQPTDHPYLNVRGAQYIGKRLVVIKAIVNGKGKVRVGDSEWLAIGPDAEVGETVEVVGVHGTSLQVERVDTSNES